MLMPIRAVPLIIIIVLVVLRFHIVTCSNYFFFQFGKINLLKLQILEEYVYVYVYEIRKC